MLKFQHNYVLPPATSEHVFNAPTLQFSIGLAPNLSLKKHVAQQFQSQQMPSIF